MQLLSRRSFIAALASGIASGVAPGVASAVSARASAPPMLARTARVAVHPAVGVARVGNSRDNFFFGPEVPGAVPRGPFKDDEGAIVRQAARFRIFAYDENGNVLGEVTARDAAIAWEVRVANKKAAWYETDIAFDTEGAPGAGRRNADVSDRASLVIEAAPRRLAGAAAPPLPLDGGRFQGIPITLGEVMTDGEGRLVVLPGSGQAYAAADAPPLDSFADNSGWADDSCDGPIHATVTIGARRFEADPGWLVCVPPNYAPGIAQSIVTVYDAIESALIEAGEARRPRTVFERHVWPVFRRMADFQWVNEGFSQNYGFGAPKDWSTPQWRERLADSSPGNAMLRRSVFALFRDPASAKVDPHAEPQLYGDEVAVPYNSMDQRQWLSLTVLQYHHLANWAAGRFLRRRAARAEGLENLPPSRQPAALDRANLDACIGGAFHPGIEFPWIVRVPWIWTRDFRVATAAREVDRTDYGDTLTAPVVLSRAGPLSRMGPGSFTQWMGVPWQADASSCRFGYERAMSPVLPGFWPARIPNGVLSEADYQIVLDTARSLDERRAAFGRRRDWERFIAAPTRQPILAAMTQGWFKLGLIVERPGPADRAFPAVMKVETGVGFEREPDVLYPASVTFPQYGTFPLVVSNSDDNSLRMVDAASRVSVMQLSDRLERPEGLTRGLDGNIYVCCMDGNVIRRVTPDGKVSVFASGSFASPVSITQDRNGNFYVANYDKKGFVTLVTAEGKSSILVPPESGLVQPVGVAISPDKVLLVSWGGEAIARVDMASGKVLSPRWIGGLSNPRQMAFDRSNRLYVADQLNNTIRRFDPTGVPTSLTLRGAGLVKPFGLAFDVSGLLYATITGGSLVKRIRLQGDIAIVSDFAAEMKNGGGIAFLG